MITYTNKITGKCLFCWLYCLGILNISRFIREDLNNKWRRGGGNLTFYIYGRHRKPFIFSLLEFFLDLEIWSQDIFNFLQSSQFTANLNLSFVGSGPGFFPSRIGSESLVTRIYSLPCRLLCAASYIKRGLYWIIK